MTEQQTPAPTPGRSYYGFLLYIFGWAGIFCYLTWALVPHEYLNQIGISYLPQRYWALAFPSLLLAALLLFVGLVYPGINLMLSPPPHDMRNLEDDKTIRREAYDSEDYYFLSEANDGSSKEQPRGRGKRKGKHEACKRKTSRRCSKRGGSSGDTQEGEDTETEDCFATVPPVYDLHISEVCQILYGGVE